MGLKIFSLDGTLHKEVWIATKVSVAHTQGVVWYTGETPAFFYDLYAGGIYQYSAPAQSLKMAELFIGNTPILFRD